MTNAIDIEGLSYAYGPGQPVLQQLRFAVRKGDFFIIIGPNGSGKTTLLKILAGLIKVRAGEVRIMGRRLSAYPRKTLARRIAYVPQQTPGDFPFQVSDVVLFGRAPHLGTFGMESQSDRDMAAKAMQFMEIDHLAARRIDQLSGGECQRVFIARAICQDPEIILLDEPTAALDLSHQLRVMDLMEKMKAEKAITVAMVSHDINLAAMYADSLLLLHNGTLVQYGPPNDVLSYQTLEQAYSCPLLVDESPLGPMPRVTPVPGRYIRPDLAEGADSAGDRETAE
ncbi:MAG: ABC transporter ATP-binding protein [Thermodesulfobacteriota bacterium]